MKTSLFLAVAAAAAALPAIAGAQPPSGSASTKVVYQDLDLATAAGRKSLDSRIRGAVGRVCGQSAGPGLDEWLDYRRCLRDARTAAATQARLAIARADGRRVSGAALAAR